MELCADKESHIAEGYPCSLGGSFRPGFDFISEMCSGALGYHFPHRPVMKHNLCGFSKYEKCSILLILSLGKEMIPPVEVIIY